MSPADTMNRPNSTVEAEAALHETPDELLCLWLGRLVETHDLRLPLAASGPRAVALEGLVAAVSAEFAAYAGIVLQAGRAMRDNGEALEGVAQLAGEQCASVRSTASAAREARDGAALMTTAAASLVSFAGAAGRAAAEARSGLAAIATTLDTLAARLIEGQAPLIGMRDATDGVAAFLVTLARLSRHAQLLAVNASIESAHLAEAGSRFAIVAQEVRKLSVSTRESKADVTQIVGELRAWTAQISTAAEDSNDATSAAASEIRGAGEALVRTGRGIEQFEAMVSTVADVAANQQMALEAVGASIEQLAGHADDAASASRSADLDAGTLLDRASASANRWMVRTDPAGHHASAPDAVCRWIGELIAGDAAAIQAKLDAEPADTALVAALRRFIEAVNAQGRQILGDVIAVAVAVSHNGYAWTSVDRSLAGVRAELSSIHETIAESSQGAGQSSQVAGEMRRLVDTIRAQYDRALASLEGALTRIARIAASVREIDGFVESMNAAAGRADEIMALIETLSSETDLLSLNAAIEAAHAGEQGHGFSIIAEEIRALARSTNQSTLHVSERVSTIKEISGALQTSIGAAAASTYETTSSAERVRAAIADLRTALESATRDSLHVSEAAATQLRALDRLTTNLSSSADVTHGAATSNIAASRLELATLGSRAHAVAGRRSIGTVAERVRSFAAGLCVQIEAIVEAALGGRLDLDRLFDFEYRPVAGAEIASMARLFDVSRVPSSGFDPAKFVTPWDAALDELNDVLERALDAAPFAATTIVVCDLNGFLYASPRKKNAGWTNDPATDNAGNRIKRIFEDEYSLRVVRCGLGECAGLVPQRASYDRFRAAGCTLEPVAVRPWGGFVYARDTRVVCNEIVMAMYARGMRHSTLRILYDATLV